jgi:hypothetical protein
MSQTRIVLDADDRPKAEAILDATGIKTFSQLFAIFIHNYGDHLVNALKASPVPPPPPVVMPQPATNKQMPTIQPTQAAHPKQFKPMAGL